MQNLLKEDKEELPLITLDTINKIIYSLLHRNNFYQLRDSKVHKAIQISKILSKI